jgi:diguanylate cyclase (GGDEF)-like protein
MKAADFSPTNQSPQRFRSLRRKVYLPYIILIVLLSASAIWGALHLAKKSYTNSADQRLLAAQEVLFREFKKHEDILQTYAIIMQQFQALSERHKGASETGILQDHLYNTLEKADISTAFYPANIRGIIQQESLITLFDQVRRSGRERFRYSNEFGGTPVLMVAAPLYKSGEVVKIMLLQTAMGDDFLKDVAGSLNLKASLLTLEGKIVARSSKNFTSIDLSPAQISHLGTGQKLFRDHQATDRLERHLFSIIPLGSSDMVLLSLEADLKDFTKVQTSLIMRMIMIMVVIILACSIFYFRQVNSIIQPAKDLQNAANAIRRGDLNFRIVNISDDEFGQIAESFNKMANELESTYQERANKEIANAIALEEHKTKRMLDKKELETEKVNEVLHSLQRETSALYQLNQAMTAAIDLTSLFDRILQTLNDILACDHIVLLSHSAGDSVLEIERVSGIDREVLNNVRFTFDQGITGEAARSQRMIYVKDLDEDDRNLSYHGQVATRGSMISVPLVVKNRLVGVINLHKRKKESFSLSEQKLVQAVANQTAIAIDNAQLIEKSQEFSNTDELTGLSNRRHFQDILKREVAQARRFSSNFSIIMCDIDEFRQLKSTLGSFLSDALLRQVGQSLLKCTRGIDLVSRFGNDQFIILLPKTNKAGATAAADKLRLRIAEEDYSLQLNTDKKFNVTVSFGVTEFPADSKNIYELLNLADRSLFAAKKDGGNCSVAWEGRAPGPE